MSSSSSSESYEEKPLSCFPVIGLIGLVCFYFVLLFYHIRFPFNIYSESENDSLFLLNTTTLSNDPLPVLARIVHLILVENMEEVNEFIDFLPSITSDVVFNCWNDDCYDPRSKSSKMIYVGSWNSHIHSRRNRIGQMESFDRQQDLLLSTTELKGFWNIQPSVYFINEKSLNLSRRTTLTESRNRLAAFIEPRELKQGWKWAYINIMDGDGHLECPSINTINTESWKVQFDRWYTLMRPLSSEAICWLAFNAFLLTSAPGIGLPVFFDRNDEWKGGMMTFHFDGVIAAFHHDLFPIMHPLCEKYDTWTYWSSQAYLILQTVCYIGHVYTNSYIHAINKDHRVYPHNPAFEPFTKPAIKEMNVLPERLFYMLDYLWNGETYNGHLTPVVSFDFYTGFNLKTMIDQDCITHMSDPSTCIRT